MAHFQIFIPGAITNSPSCLDAVGLADLNDGRAQLVPTDGTLGPEGLAGVTVAWPVPSDRRMGCRLAEQTWIPALPSHDGDAGRYWCGFWHDSPPRPEELMRPAHQRLNGELVELGDGGRWLAPSFWKLPQDIVSTADGEFTLRPKKRFLGIMELGQLWSHRLLKQTADIPWAEIVEAVLTLLRLNYRIVPECNDLLGLLDTDNALRPLLAFIGASQDLATFTPGDRQ